MGDMKFDWDDVIVALDESDKWRIFGTDGEYYYIEPNQLHSYISMPQKPISLMNIIFMPPTSRLM